MNGEKFTLFSDLPKPANAEEAAVAIQLGMIVLRGIKEVRDMEVFAGTDVPSVFNAIMEETSGDIWRLMVGRG